MQTKKIQKKVDIYPDKLFYHRKKRSQCCVLLLFYIEFGTMNRKMLVSTKKTNVFQQELTS